MFSRACTSLVDYRKEQFTVGEKLRKTLKDDTTEMCRVQKGTNYFGEKGQGNEE